MCRPYIQACEPIVPLSNRPAARNSETLTPSPFVSMRMMPIEAEKLFNDHARGIHAAVYRLTLDAAAADDATQEAFVRLLQSPPPLTDNMGAWLKRVAVNFAI